MSNKEVFDLDPTSKGYVGRSQREVLKHTVRDVRDLADAVQFFLREGADSDPRDVAAAATILEAAASKLRFLMASNEGKA